MLLKILHIRSTIKDIKTNPGNFAESQASDVIMGILILPIVIAILGLAFLFALAFTKFLGGPYLFFKIIFFIGLFTSSIIGFIIYKLTLVLSNTTKKVINETVENVVKTDNTIAPN